jgi:hypothetical protein
MFNRLLKSLLFAFLLATFLPACRPGHSRSTGEDPGHRHASEVGEMKLPNGQ